MSLDSAVHSSPRATAARASGQNSVAALFTLVALAALAVATLAGPVHAQKSPQPAQQPMQAPGAVPTAPLGVWVDDTGRGAVEIRNCGDSLCGNVVWLQEPINAKGQPTTDGYNPDASKRTRPVCGIQVIGEARLQGDGTWDNGWIYDPKTGKEYDVEITVLKPDRLKVMGYKGVKFLSKSFTWTRAPSNIVRCDQTTMQNAPPVPKAAASQRAK